MNRLHTLRSPVIPSASFLKGGMAPMGKQWDQSSEMKGCSADNSTAEVELQLGFGFLVFDHIHHLKAGIFRLPLLGKCFEDHGARSLPVLIDFNQLLGS